MNIINSKNNKTICTSSSTSSSFYSDNDTSVESSSPQHKLIKNEPILHANASLPSYCYVHDSSHHNDNNDVIISSLSSSVPTNPLIQERTQCTPNHNDQGYNRIISNTKKRRRKKVQLGLYPCRSLHHHHHVLPPRVPIGALLSTIIISMVLSQHLCYAFLSSSSSLSLVPKPSFFTIVPTIRTCRTNICSYKSIKASASASSSEETIIQAVQPLTTSSREKRLSVQRAWEEQVQLLDNDNHNNNNNNNVATPFLDLFADAGIATVKQVQQQQQQRANKLVSSSSTPKHVKPRGRPASVPGAMSRATMMGIHEMKNRSTSSTTYNNGNNNNCDNNNVNVNPFNNVSKWEAQGRHRDERSNTIRKETSNNTFTEDSFDSNSSLLSKQQNPQQSTLSSSSSSSPSRLDIRKTIKQQSSLSSTSSAVAASILKKKMNKGRGRGRPRKDKGNNASIDEITSIAATSSLQNDNNNNKNDNISSRSSNSSYSNDDLVQRLDQIQNDANANFDTTSEIHKSTTKSRRGELTTLRPKAKKLKESEKEGETTGMMQMGRSGKDGEPPNLQRYYRTELLTPEEEYRLGMKIQFMINCEQVHDGLLIRYERNPTIVEWARACGFKIEDPLDYDVEYMTSDYVNQIRPLKSETIDPVEDANMFVGNGLVNESGPGRGRGRSKKRPPSKLGAYYDDSDIKFDSNYKEKAKLLKPLNRGTAIDFVELMIIAKESKQRMVQCNMRLVVSISKRYKHVGVNIADLVQEGSIGLTRAAEKFDPKKGFKFSTYASWWIQQAVFRSIAYHSRTIRLPVHVHNLLNRTRRVRLELQRILGRAPTNDEMAAELDMSLEKYNKMIRLTRKAISLDMAKYQNNPKDIGQESETSLGDTIDATEVIRDENSPEQSVDQVLFRDDLKEMLKILGEDEKAVICARYGINDGLTRTVTTVAAQMGQSKSWVRSQECRALRKLRRPWYEKRLWEHQNSLTS